MSSHARNRVTYLLLSHLLRTGRKKRPSINMTDNPSDSQPNNPLHGVTLLAMLEHLVELYGWDDLGARIDIRCFVHDPSIKSSLKFLRKTDWARAKVERLYLKSIRDGNRVSATEKPRNDIGNDNTNNGIDAKITTRKFEPTPWDR